MTSLLKAPMNGSLAARRDPEVVAIAKRRQFSGSEKRRLLAEALRCKEATTLTSCRLPHGRVPISYGASRWTGLATMHEGGTIAARSIFFLEGICRC